MLHENHDHHEHRAHHDLHVYDQHGNPIRAQGFRGSVLYEDIIVDKRQRVWLEDADRNIVWQQKRYNHPGKAPKWTVEELLAFRNAAYPKATLCIWEGDDEGHFVLIDRPGKRGQVNSMGRLAPVRLATSTPSKGAKKRRSCRIKKAG